MIAFQSNPRSRTADLEGLGTISMQLTMALVKKSEAHIKWLMESGRFDGYDRDCLDVCLELHSDLKSTLRETLKALEEKSYRDANVWVSAVMDVAVTCEDGFREKGEPIHRLLGLGWAQSTRNGEGDDGRRSGERERGDQERESGEEKTERVKEGAYRRHMMHGRKERMREDRGFLDPNM
ncbi:hypothetical protein MRB53_017253 [Persea americana]|uniref:Uncharacterized protein n=1 Tax=Persea americana TaxID=3435 RepID=A0ACC2M5H5_PERAE|nr:hypothetical protein MRB53_017253 [Persea americana]